MWDEDTVGIGRPQLRTPISNKALERRYKLKLDTVELYYQNTDIVRCREIEKLDIFRHEDFPDDVQVALFKSGVKLELIWMRCTEYIGSQDGAFALKGKLLNEPFGEFGIHVGSIVTFFNAVAEGNERINIAILNDDTQL